MPNYRLPEFYSVFTLLSTKSQVMFMLSVLFPRIVCACAKVVAFIPSSNTAFVNDRNEFAENTVTAVGLKDP